MLAWLAGDVMARVGDRPDTATLRLVLELSPQPVGRQDCPPAQGSAGVQRRFIGVYIPRLKNPMPVCHI